MNVCILGLWHLGTVTAACLAARGVSTVGITEQPEDAISLNEGVPPLFEPGLEELLRGGLSSGCLRFTHDRAQAIPNADIVWVTFDTPVDESDIADTDYVTDRVKAIFP